MTFGKRSAPDHLQHHPLRERLIHGRCTRTTSPVTCQFFYRRIFGNPDCRHRDRTGTMPFYTTLQSLRFLLGLRLHLLFLCKRFCKCNGACRIPKRHCLESG